MYETLLKNVANSTPLILPVHACFLKPKQHVDTKLKVFSEASNQLLTFHRHHGVPLYVVGREQLHGGVGGQLIKLEIVRWCGHRQH